MLVFKRITHIIRNSVTCKFSLVIVRIRHPLKIRNMYKRRKMRMFR